MELHANETSSFHSVSASPSPSWKLPRPVVQPSSPEQGPVRESNPLPALTLVSCIATAPPRSTKCRTSLEPLRDRRAVHSVTHGINGGPSSVLPARPMSVNATEDPNAKLRTLKTASANRHFKIYRKAEVPDRWHYKNSPRAPPLLLVADHGYAFDDLYAAEAAFIKEWHIILVSLLAYHQGDPGSVRGRDFHMWDSGRTMSLVGEFSRGSPVSPALSFRRCSIRTSITLIGSQDMDVKSRPNIFTHSTSFHNNDEMQQVVITRHLAGQQQHFPPRRESSPVPCVCFGTREELLGREMLVWCFDVGEGGGVGKVVMRERTEGGGDGGEGVVMVCGKGQWRGMKMGICEHGVRVTRIRQQRLRHAALLLGLGAPRSEELQHLPIQQRRPVLPVQQNTTAHSTGNQRNCNIHYGYSYKQNLTWIVGKCRVGCNGIRDQSGSRENRHVVTSPSAILYVVDPARKGKQAMRENLRPGEWPAAPGEHPEPTSKQNQCCRLAMPSI
ncbi:hypothetical protein PR048_026458 [Dryococelus australis]|uniref:Uncharacterized protein n=1 Tax=Dryococelus australis TaxID=614101 RepID=A0ABQ9GLG3_9NEOP|nr:hypothetical protein PR048_026458 [Dryococelus australis]